MPLHSLSLQIFLSQLFPVKIQRIKTLQGKSVKMALNQMISKTRVHSFMMEDNSKIIIKIHCINQAIINQTHRAKQYKTNYNKITNY